MKGLTLGSLVKTIEESGIKPPKNHSSGCSRWLGKFYVCNCGLDSEVLKAQKSLGLYGMNVVVDPTCPPNTIIIGDANLLSGVRIENVKVD
jgi:hypothetical protein